MSTMKEDNKTYTQVNKMLGRINRLLLSGERQNTLRLIKEKWNLY